MSGIFVYIFSSLPNNSVRERLLPMFILKNFRQTDFLKFSKLVNKKVKIQTLDWHGGFIFSKCFIFFSVSPAPFALNVFLAHLSVYNFQLLFKLAQD